jgi:Carboxypeptidase regulatory-like domain
MIMNTRIVQVFLLTAIAAMSILVAQPKRDNPEPFFRGSDKKDKNEEAILRIVQGVVKDESDNFVEGAVVQLKNKKTDQIRSFITLQDGAYKFNGLSPNIDYELKAASKGRVSGTKIVSVFDARKKMIMNLKVEKKESK